ncbi:MAG: glycosyltransferase family 9 protein [Candidatus Anstonellales archaeon]
MKKILIRGPDTIGSFVLATPFYRELRKNLPKDYIVLCVKPLVYQLAKNCPYVNKVILYEKNFFSNLKNFMSEKFETVYLISGSFESAFVSYLAKIKERIGYPHDHRGFLLTKKIFEKEKKHYIDYMLFILESLGFSVEDRQPELYIKKFSDTKFDYIFEDKVPVVGITYSSIANDARNWPLNYVIELSYKLIENGYKVVLLGKNRLHKKVDIGNKEFIDLVNLTSLEEFINIVRKLHTYISVATGGLHIAALLGIKTVALYIPGDESWLPYGENVSVIIKNVKCGPCNQHKMKYCKDNKCLKIITPDEVFKTISSRY